MKITQVEIYHVTYGPKVSGWHPIIVRIHTDEGISGIGEVALAYGVGSEAAVGMVRQLAERLLIGADPSRIEHTWNAMYRRTFWGQGGGPVVYGAMSGIDEALWDIKGKALGVPVYELLGGRVRDKVVCYPHNRSHPHDVAPLVESCLSTVEEGWKFVRWGLPQEGKVLEPRQAVRMAIRQFQAVREAVGDGVEICFDAHTRLDLPEAVWLCREVEVQCQVAQIPEDCKVDISELAIGHAVHVEDLVLPEGITVLTPPERVVATVIAKVVAAEPTAAEAEEAEAEAEGEEKPAAEEGESKAEETKEK